MIIANNVSGTHNPSNFQLDEKKKELNRMIGVLSNSQRQYDSEKSEKNLHYLIDSLVSIDLTLLDFINHYNLNPAQFNILKFPLIDVYSVKLFENNNETEFHKNICLCYNIIAGHFEKLQQHNNVIFESFSKHMDEKAS